MARQHFDYACTAVTLQVKTGAGLLHTITISQADAAPTAGIIGVYDGVAGGLPIFVWAPTTAVFMPFTLTLDVEFLTGLYVLFVTTADVYVTVSYT